MQETPSRITKMLGLRNDVPTERMQPGDLSHAVNVHIDASGEIKRRSGYTLANAGMTAGLFGGAGMTFCVRGGKLCQVNADYSLTMLTDASPAIVYAAINDVVYWTDGQRTGIVEHNRARSWGLPVPDLTMASLTTGTLPPGTYQYAWTFVRSDGQQSGASATGYVILDTSGGIQATAPSCDDTDVAGAMLYLSTANGEIVYEAASVALGQTARVTSDVALSAPLLTRYLLRAPVGQALLYHAGRMWVGSGDAIYPSSPFSHELFDLNEWLPVNGRVTMLADSPAGLFVGTDKGSFYLEGLDPASMTLVPKNTDPVLPGGLSFIPGHLMDDPTLKGQDIPVWAGSKSLYAGHPDGTVRPLTEPRFTMALAGQGAMYFDQALKQIVFSAKA